MKILDRIIQFIFAIIVLGFLILWVLLTSNVVNLEEAAVWIKPVLIKEVYPVWIVLALFILKSLFFQSKEKRVPSSILLENSKGKLLIAKATIENIVKQACEEIDGVENALGRVVINKNKQLMVEADIVISNNILIKDISQEIQENVIKAIKSTIDLDIKEVNINIKKVNISKNTKSETQEKVEEKVEEKEEVKEEEK